jgi:hypothetical protein
MAIELEAHEQREVGRKARLAVLDAVKALGGEAMRRSILERAILEGGFTDRELAARPPERAREKHETFVHYRLSWALTNLKGEGLLENPKWSLWRLAGAASQEPAQLLAERVSQERLIELRAMPAPLYRRTPEWRRTRAAALERAGHRCSLDRTHTDRLEVHHNTYDRVGAELASDLVVLCHSCHEVHHDAYGRPRRPRPDPTTSLLPRSGSLAPPSARATPSDDVEQASLSVAKRSFLRRILAGA